MGGNVNSSNRVRLLARSAAVERVRECNKHNKCFPVIVAPRYGSANAYSKSLSASDTQDTAGPVCRVKQNGNRVFIARRTRICGVGHRQCGRNLCFGAVTRERAATWWTS